jgi:arylsulfatase B
MMLLTLPAPPQSPDVLVMVADDLGWSERPLMSSLDALAAQGVTFTRAYSQPTCSISRIEAMFGRLHRRQGVGDLSMNAHDPTQDRLPVELVSVAELLLPTHATALVGKWHLGRANLFGEMDSVTSGPWAQGWEAWPAGNPSVLNAGQGATGYYGWKRVTRGDMEISSQYATDAQRDALLDWWTTTPAPRFAWLAWSAPHSPFDPPPGNGPAATTREAYEHVARYLDAQIAAVLAQVDLSSTFVVFVSDNGTPDEARPVGTPTGSWKGSVREGGIRVPLIVAGPGVVPGTTSRVVSLVDLPATIAELVGAQISRGFEDSVSFAGALGDWVGAPERVFAFSERYEVRGSSENLPQPVGYDGQAVIERNWKLVHEDPDGSGPGGFVDLYYHMPDELPLVPSESTQARLHAELASLPERAP